MRTSNTVKKSQRGLTLVEVMLVVGVLAILSAVVYPIYTNMVQKARRAEAKTALQELALAQERFFNMNGTYANSGSQLFGDNSAWNAFTDDQTHYNISALSGNTTNFSITASPVGGQVGDTKCGNLSIDHLGTTDADGSDSDACW